MRALPLTPAEARRLGRAANHAPAPRDGGERLARAALASRPWMILLFLICLALPFSVFIGSARVSPARAVMLIAVIPLLAGLLAGRYGRVTATDWAVIAYASWVGLSLWAVHGAARAQFMGISTVEALAPYLLARAAVRDAAGYRAFARGLLWLLALLLPFSVIEARTDRPPIIDALSFLPVYEVVHKAPRLGLYRVQNVFEHPILYGVFASSALSLAFLVAAPRAGRGVRIGLAAIPALATFLSLSMGAFVGMMAQIGLLSWDRVLAKVRARWKLLIWLVAGAYLALDLASNRTPFHLVVDYMTFNSGNAYNRILIWENGIDDVWRNPAFGIGLNDWTRPDWMSPSMDNFWLVQAVRHGLPGFLFIALGVVLSMRGLARVRLAAPGGVEALCRKAHLITLTGLCLAICTVHLWNNSYLLFMFFLGAGQWMAGLDSGVSRGPSSAEVEPTRRGARWQTARSGSSSG